MTILCPRHQDNYFYPRPHMEGDCFCFINQCIECDFYPRPHMEGDMLYQYQCMSAQFISTHALTWRATPCSSSCVWCKKFLPTPSHGGRRLEITLKLLLSHFYPRPHMEGDGRLLSLDTGGACISTHALTWRATAQAPRAEPTQKNFYPRPHMEGDSKHAEVQACISAAYLKCSTRKAAASSRRAGLGGRVVLFHQLSRLVLGRARCEPRGEGMCDRGSHRQSGRRKGLKTHSSKMSSWLH